MSAAWSQYVPERARKWSITVRSYLDARPVFWDCKREHGARLDTVKITYRPENI